MKVEELIENLKKLDKEKGIWVVYDGYCAAFPPLPDEKADKATSEYFATEGVEEGDYIISVG